MFPPVDPPPKCDSIVNCNDTIIYKPPIPPECEDVVEEECNIPKEPDIFKYCKDKFINEDNKTCDDVPIIEEDIPFNCKDNFNSIDHKSNCSDPNYPVNETNCYDIIQENVIVFPPIYSIDK